MIRPPSFPLVVDTLDCAVVLTKYLSESRLLSPKLRDILIHGNYENKDADTSKVVPTWTVNVFFTSPLTSSELSNLANYHLAAQAGAEPTFTEA